MDFDQVTVNGVNSNQKRKQVKGMKNRKRLAMAGAVLLGFVLGIGGTNAYLTSHDQMINTIGIGKNTTTIEEDFPIPSPIPEDENSDIPKEVRIVNGQGEAALVDCYVRVSVGYSNSDIGRAAVLKQLDRTNWLEAEDGFYYYKKILREGEKTTPLFTGIFIDASKLEKTYLDQIDTFEVQIYEESVQAAGFGDYKSAWEYYRT